MVKCQTIKLEFTPNSSKSFEVCTKIYGSHIECAGKAAGKIGNDYFSAKYRFNIDARTQKICSIHFTDVTHIGKTDTPQFACNRYYYYYDINDSDSDDCYSNIIDDSFEQQVYNALYSIFSSGTVTQSGTTLSLTITLTNTSTSTINYLVLHIKVGAHSYGNSSSVYNENSISDAIGKSCSKSCSKTRSKYCSKSSSCSSHKKCTSSSSTGSITTSSKTSTSSLFTSKSSKSKKSHKKHKKSGMQNILKLIAWSAIISFIMYIFKTKINGGRR